VLRLLDGTRAYVYAVIDNFSRRILGWRVSESFDPRNTLAILLEAGRSATSTGSPPTLLADSGVENRIRDIDSVGSLRRLVAFYVEKHNGRLPRSAFRGQTPDEMYFGTGHPVPAELDAKRKEARTARRAAHRARSCRVCRATEVE
jgi:putative transposase